MGGESCKIGKKSRLCKMSKDLKPLKTSFKLGPSNWGLWESTLPGWRRWRHGEEGASRPPSPVGVHGLQGRGRPRAEMVTVTLALLHPVVDDQVAAVLLLCDSLILFVDHQGRVVVCVVCGGGAGGGRGGVGHVAVGPLDQPRHLSLSGKGRRAALGRRRRRGRLAQPQVRRRAGGPRRGHPGRTGDWAWKVMERLWSRP